MEGGNAPFLAVSLLRGGSLAVTLACNPVQVTQPRITAERDGDKNSLSRFSGKIKKKLCMHTGAQQSAKHESSPGQLLVPAHGSITNVD